MSLFYRPDDYESVVQNATVGVKFCQDIFLMKSFLDQQNIPYKIEDLEDGPFGLGIRIKKERNENARHHPQSPKS